MTTDNEQQAIRAEVHAILQEYGINPTVDARRGVVEAGRLKDLAMQVIDGNIDTKELAAFGGDFASELSAMVQRLMALKNANPIRELQEVNPFYSAFQPKVIRDSAREKSD